MVGLFRAGDGTFFEATAGFFGDLESGGQFFASGLAFVAQVLGTGTQKLFTIVDDGV
jgi:hypothetical protein